MKQQIFLKAKVIVLTSALIAFLSQMLVTAGPSVQAQNSQYKYEQQSEVAAKPVDKRALMLSAYLAQYNSPLQNHAQTFIEAADKNGVDWKLVPAISGVESTFGKHTPGSDAYPSYNGWGWGVYGNQALHFKSWKDGIYTLNEGLKTKYIDRGLTTPAQMNRVYAASPTWGVRVNHFMQDMAQFEADYKNPSEPILSKEKINPAFNSDSAVLTLN